MYFLLKDKYRGGMQLWHSGMFGFIEHQVTLRNGMIEYTQQKRIPDKEMDVICTSFTLNGILARYAIEKL